MRNTEKKLDDLAVDQEQLQKKVKEAQNIADPQKREEELKKLALQQKALQQRTQDLVKELSRLRAERTGHAPEQSRRRDGASGRRTRARPESRR